MGKMQEQQEKQKQQEQLERIHRCEMDLALELKRICELHGIRYFLIAGTLLGAVRHKGFIPWDDDMDFGMLRSDYSRFLSVAPKELSPDFFLQTWDTDHAFGSPYAKLRYNGTKFVEKNSARVRAHQGIYIDIFPYDNVPAEASEQRRHKAALYLLTRLLLTKKGYEVWAAGGGAGKTAVYGLIRLLVKPIPAGWMKRMLQKKCTEYNGKPAERVVVGAGSYGYEREQIRLEWATDLTELEFEGYRFPCPAAWDEYLRFLYGEYMTPPPENERYAGHSIVGIDFGGRA